MAEEISRSVQRFADMDLDGLAERYGVDPDRARSFADAAGNWLNEQLSGAEPLFGAGFGSGRPRDPDGSGSGRPRDPDVPATPAAPPPAAGEPPAVAGPHPLDLPTERQGLVLSALDSRRWTVRPGSSRLAGTGEGPPPPDLPDLVNELRARDWITPDGTLTLVGRHALARWCRTVSDAAGADEPGAQVPPPPAD